MCLLARMSAQEYFYTVMDIKSFFFLMHLPIILIKNALYHSVRGIFQLYQTISCNFLVPSFHLRWHASYFGLCLLLCFISIVKQINSNPDLLPLVFHYEERRPDTNHNRTLKFPAHYSVCAQNTNQLTTRTFNKCKL